MYLVVNDLCLILDLPVFMVFRFLEVTSLECLLKQFLKLHLFTFLRRMVQALGQFCFRLLTHSAIKAEECCTVWFRGYKQNNGIRLSGQMNWSYLDVSKFKSLFLAYCFIFKLVRVTSPPIYINRNVLSSSVS